MTQLQLSRASGVPRTTIASLEQCNPRTPYIDTAMLIARALKTTVEDLFIL